MRKHKAQDWEKDPCVEKWFNQKAPSTVKAYRSYFPKWLKFIGMTPTEQIEKRHKDDISPNKKEKFFFEDKWLEFKKEHPQPPQLEVKKP